MYLLKAALLLAATTTALISPRQNSQIYKDLDSINTGVIGLTKTVTGWDGTSLLNALPINTAADAVRKQIDAAAAKVPSQPAITEAEANAVLSFIDKSLKPNVKAAADAVTAKAAKFKALSLSSIVATTLKTLSASTSAYGKALIAKAPADKKTKAQSELDTIVGYISTAQKSFV